METFTGVLEFLTFWLVDQYWFPVFLIGSGIFFTIYLGFPQIKYFEEELALISKELNIKISYVPVSDIETQIIKEENSYDFDLAIIPNPQGVVNLGERGYLYPVTVAIDNEVIDKNYSKHLQEITTSNKDQQNYGIFFRLIPLTILSPKPIYSLTLSFPDSFSILEIGVL